MEWENLKRAKYDGRLNDIGRSPEVAQKYYNFNQKTRAKYRSTTDHIFINVFKCPSYHIGNKLAAQERPAWDSVRFTLNRFPYNVDAHHFLVWFGSKQAQAIFLREGDVRKMLPGQLRDREFFIHINEPKFKTIPDIEHLHLFVKK